MALDRRSIARRDFPAARRGYEPAAVDRHLEAVADEVEELRRRASPGAALAGQASEQVRAVIEAAEASSAAIRESAAAEARDHVARVAEAADGLRERIDALERELTGVLGALRSGAERVRADLDDLAAGTTALAATTGAAPAADTTTGAAPGAAAAASARGAAPAAADASPAEAPAASASALGVTVGETAAAAAPAAPEVGEEPALEEFAETEAEAEHAAATNAAAPAGEPAPPVGRSTDVAGARLVALQWALDGRSREEVDGYLAEHYDLSDRAAVVAHAYKIASNA